MNQQASPILLALLSLWVMSGCQPAATEIQPVNPYAENPNQANQMAQNNQNPYSPTTPIVQGVNQNAATPPADQPESQENDADEDAGPNDEEQDENPEDQVDQEPAEEEQQPEDDLELADQIEQLVDDPDQPVEEEVDAEQVVDNEVQEQPVVDNQDPVDPNVQPVAVQNLDDLKAACIGPNTQTVTQEIIFFPEFAGQCNFPNTPNEGVVSGTLNAPNIELEVPQNAYLCTMNFVFNPNTFTYYEGFLLTLNGVILMSSGDIATATNFVQNGLPVYNANLLLGLPFNVLQPEQPFCFGENEQKAACSIPQKALDQNVSRFQTPELTQELSYGVYNPNQKPNFGFTTFGDDQAADCAHNGLRFTATMSYVVPN